MTTREDWERIFGKEQVAEWEGRTVQVREVEPAAEEPWLPCKARARARNYLLLTIVLFWLCAIAVYCAATGDRP